jgi:hypothetical protein
MIELLAELSRVHEEEAVAEEERIRLEATVSTDTPLLASPTMY